MPKALGGFTHWFEHKLQWKLAKISALVNSNPAPCFAFFTTSHSKLAMPLYRNVVCLAKLHIFPIGWFCIRPCVKATSPQHSLGPPLRCPGTRTPEQRGTTRDSGKKETSLRPRRHRPFQFRDPVFEITKLQKVSTYSKISKNKSCRGVIDLQLSQRATYVLINGFVWKTCWTCRNSQLRVTVHSAFNSKLSELSLKISMSANYEKCFPRNNEQLSYWPILNFYSEIWRTLKKTKSAFKEHLGFDRDLGFWPKSFVQICDKTCQTCLEAN
jgi:hypothetical protein